MVQTDFAGVPFRRGQFRRSPFSPESGFAGVSFAGVRFRRGPVSPGSDFAGVFSLGRSRPILVPGYLGYEEDPPT